MWGICLSCHACVLKGSFAADPLCWHGATRARVAHEYLLATEAGLKAMYNYTFPFIVFHGADDTLTDPDGSQQLFERSKVGQCADSLARLSRICTSLVCRDRYIGRMIYEGEGRPFEIAISDRAQKYVECGLDLLQLAKAAAACICLGRAQSLWEGNLAMQGSACCIRLTSVLVHCSQRIRVSSSSPQGGM